MTIPTQEEVLDLIADEALIDRAKLSPEETLESLGIDSVDTVSVLFALEEKYGIRVETEDLSREQTLGQLIQFVQKKASAA